MLRTDVINALISKHGLKSYLEIGVQNPTKNFNKVHCFDKTGVDPDSRALATHCMTSDQFFNSIITEIDNGDNGHRTVKRKYDLIFIDGLHEADQVVKDISNSLKVLNNDGFIVMHDCNPTTEEMQRVPRIQSEWTGDTWKAFVKFRQRDDLIMYVVDTDYGVGVIARGNSIPVKVVDPTYASFTRNKKEWLNLISVNQFKLLYE
jgi:hypothetical protein